MTGKPIQYVVITSPVDRQLRELLAEILGQPIPIYTGSVQDLCDGCGMAVWVGPRQRLLDALKLCPWCVAGRTAGGAVEIRSLGNPEHDGRKR